MNYFGEKTNSDCGICSYCIKKGKIKKDDATLSDKIIGILKFEDLNSREIQSKTNFSTNEIIFALQQLLELNTIKMKSNNKYTLQS